MGLEVGINLKRKNSHHIFAFCRGRKIALFDECFEAYLSQGGSHFDAKATQFNEIKGKSPMKYPKLVSTEVLVIKLLKSSLLPIA